MLLNPAQAAKRLGISRRTLSRYVENKTIKYIEFPPTNKRAILRFDSEELDAFIQKHTKYRPTAHPRMPGNIIRLTPIASEQNDEDADGTSVRTQRNAS